MNVDVNITSRQGTEEIGVHISKSKQSLSVRQGGPTCLLAISSLEKSGFPVNAACVLYSLGPRISRSCSLPVLHSLTMSGRDTQGTTDG